MSTQTSHYSPDQTESWHASNGADLRQVVFGVNDGLVATIGLVAGLTFAGSHQGIVIGATLAAIIAAVVSMALGSYLSTRTEVRYYQAQVHREQTEITNEPEEELSEMHRIYRGYGFSEEETQIFLKRFQQDHDLWLKLMLRDELGIIPDTFESPIKNAGVMALAVLLGSLPPLIPNFVSTHPLQAFPWVVFLSALSAFVLGAAAGKSTGDTWWRSGISFLVVSAIAAGIGMGAGHLITPLLGVSAP